MEAQAESHSTKSCCLLTRWVAQAHEVTLPHHGCQLGARTRLLHRPLASVGAAAVQTVTGQGVNRLAGDMLSPYGQTPTSPSLAAPRLPLKLGEHAPAVTLFGQPCLLACERLALSICPITRGSAARMAFMVLSMNPSLSTHLKKRRRKKGIWTFNTVFNKIQYHSPIWRLSTHSVRVYKFFQLQTLRLLHKKVYCLYSAERMT